MNNVTVYVETLIYPTEDEEKVRKALKNIFPEIEFSKINDEHSVLKGEGKTLKVLENFKDLLERERIRDAAKASLLSSIQNKELIFYLNKQVAFSNHISFCQPEAESPLGPITIKISCENPKDLINWLTS
ncbi:MAG: RNA-binding domain-containing protein [Candidatus Bathyarchaeia archaeon]